MRLFRISNYADLMGQGGRLYSARWHTKPRAVVYFAENAALAVLETYVQADATQDLPNAYQLLVVDADVTDGDISQPPTTLVTTDIASARRWGDAWLDGGGSVLARVPSVIAPHSNNLLFNPAHPNAARVRVVEIASHPWDVRLKRSPTRH